MGKLILNGIEYAGGPSIDDNNSSATKVYSSQKTQNLVSGTLGADVYDATHTYATNDMCIYNNTLYKAKSSTTGNLPTNTTYWEPTTIADELDLKVNKVGDTMTGNLTIAGNELHMGTTSSSSDDSGDIVWYYGNGQEKSRLWMDNTPTDSHNGRPNYRVCKSDGTQILSQKLATSGDVDGKVSKSGDTMTGDLTLSASCIREDYRNASSMGELSIYYGEDKKSYSTPSSIKDYTVCTRDANNLIGSYTQFATANQQSFISIGARAYWSNGSIAQNAYFAVAVTGPSDTPTYMVSHPKQLLDTSTSIGKLTSGTGSKTSSWTSSGAVTCHWVRSGHIVSVEYSFTVSLGSGSSLARWTTLFSGLPKPYSISYWIPGEGTSPLVLTTGGDLQNVYVINATAFFRSTFTYLTDDFN